MGLVDIGMLQTGPVLKEKDTGDVTKFLNRILGLTVEKQNMVCVVDSRLALLIITKYFDPG